ncbi:unnamed protein product [Amaranthus hypochondriacus]
MTGETEEETEYESDPEEAKMSLKMRRREASDDEDCEDERRRPSGIVDSDADSDDQGAAAEYDDEEEEEEDDEGYYDDREVYNVEKRVIGEREYEEEEGDVGVGGGVDAKGEEEVLEAKSVGEEDEGQDAERGDGEGEGGEEKKENEPFAVPTSGAFYMHDDRFKDNAGGKHRRTFGGRKLWESKDDRKWGHDKFEEMNTEDRHPDERRRSSKGLYRGRGKARGGERGYARGGRMRGYGGNYNQITPPKDVRGRGPRRYQPAMKSGSEAFPQHNKQSAKSQDKNSHSGSGRVAATANQNLEHEPVPAKKVASNLSSASPPFYPSGSSNKDNMPLTQDVEVQAGNHNRNVRSFAVEHNISMQHSTSLTRGKNVIDSMGLDKLHIDDSLSRVSVKPLSNMHLSTSASPPVGANQMTQSRPHGRGIAPSGSAVFQPQTNNQVDKVSSQAVQASQKLPVQSQGQSSQQAPGQQLFQHPLGGSQTPSPPKAGKGSSQAIGRGALAYGGGQVMAPGGNVGTGHGDPNLPAFFPVMQFGAQHRGGIPAVGMAFPGYVAQPNGLGNSEMTWLPVLASAAGALGASYCPPYIAVDGSYNTRPTGQTSALPAPSKDNNLSKPNNELKPQQRSDLANDEFSQRQTKPRRYSEMNFSQ